ncbi:uncharacterized protein VTP21DRAFT_1002 [Calcarisporiella thermophila]|uniref:uncharacterized protein n=1 Tax=Calcarisporiella thermophila TaxID=911321 RepID=UPI0037422EAE
MENQNLEVNPVPETQVNVETVKVEDSNTIRANKKAEKAAKKAENKVANKNDQKSAAAKIVPSMIDLRVGHIIQAEKHAQADSLYVEQIDCGEEEPRTVVSGLVNHIPLDEMQKRDVVLVCNLKPVNMRGVKSFAMVLAATTAEGKVELVDPPKGSKPGDRVYFEGFEEGTPEAVLNPKKKIWETIQPGLKTTEQREAAWIDPENGQIHLIRTHLGTCTVPTGINALIK